MKSNVKFPLKHKIRIALAISILLCSVTTLSVAMFLFSKAIRTSTQNGLKNTKIFRVLRSVFGLGIA